MGQGGDGRAQGSSRGPSPQQKGLKTQGGQSSPAEEPGHSIPPQSTSQGVGRRGRLRERRLLRLVTFSPNKSSSVCTVMNRGRRSSDSPLHCCGRRFRPSAPNPLCALPSSHRPPSLGWGRWGGASWWHLQGDIVGKGRGQRGQRHPQGWGWRCPEASPCLAQPPTAAAWSGIRYMGGYEGGPRTWERRGWLVSPHPTGTRMVRAASRAAPGRAHVRACLCVLCAPVPTWAAAHPVPADGPRPAPSQWWAAPSGSSTPPPTGTSSTGTPSRGAASAAPWWATAASSTARGRARPSMRTTWSSGAGAWRAGRGGGCWGEASPGYTSHAFPAGSTVPSSKASRRTSGPRSPSTASR